MIAQTMIREVTLADAGPPPGEITVTESGVPSGDFQLEFYGANASAPTSLLADINSAGAGKSLETPATYAVEVSPSISDTEASVEHGTFGENPVFPDGKTTGYPADVPQTISVPGLSTVTNRKRETPQVAPRIQFENTPKVVGHSGALRQEIQGLSVEELASGDVNSADGSFDLTRKTPRVEPSDAQLALGSAAPAGGIKKDEYFADNRIQLRSIPKSEPEGRPVEDRNARPTARTIDSSKTEELRPFPNVRDAPPVSEAEDSPQSKKLAGSEFLDQPRPYDLSRKVAPIMWSEGSGDVRVSVRESNDAQPAKNEWGAKPTPEDFWMGQVKRNAEGYPLSDMEDRLVVRASTENPRQTAHLRSVTGLPTSTGPDTQQAVSLENLSANKEDSPRVRRDNARIDPVERAVVPTLNPPTSKQGSVPGPNSQGVLGGSLTISDFSGGRVESNGSIAIESSGLVSDGEFKRSGPFGTVAGDTGAARTEVSRPVVVQLTEAVRAASNGIIEVRLSPEELGRVKLSFSPSETGLTVTFLAERPETMDLIRRNVEILAQDLRQQGHQNLNFQFGQNDRHAQHFLASQRSEADSAFQEEISSTLIIANPKTAITDGRLDLRL